MGLATVGQFVRENLNKKNAAALMSWRFWISFFTACFFCSFQKTYILFCYGMGIAYSNISVFKIQERKEVNIMSIQPAINASNNLYVSTLAKDFQSLQNDVQAYEKSQTSGNQDQITISQDALNKALTQFQSDIASLSPGTQGANGHHHHRHHHGMSAVNGSGNTTTDSPASAPATSDANGRGNATTDNLVAALATPAADNNNSQSQNSVFNVNLTA